MELFCFFLYKIFKSIKISVANIIDQLTAYLSTMMPARIAWATLRNLGFSSPRRLMLLIDLVKVSANQSLTSLGTASGSTSLSSSSSSHKRLTKQKEVNQSHFCSQNEFKRQMLVLLVVLRNHYHVIPQARCQLVISSVVSKIFSHKYIV